jgi:preprotein translocase subunit SecE
MNIFKKTVTFLSEVRLELGKVSWSTRQELIGATFAVIIITLIMGLFIGGIDMALSKILSVMFK